MTGHEAFEEGRYQVSHVVGVGPGPEGAYRCVVEGLLVHLLAGYVGGELQHHRAAAAMSELGEGHSHQLRDPVRPVDVGLPLGDPAVVPHRLEVRVHPGPVRSRAAGNQQYGDRVRVRLGDAGKGVLGARTLLHCEHADDVAVSDPAEAVRHIDPGPLLAGKDGSDPFPRTRIYQGLGREAGHPVHSLGLQDPGHHFIASHLLSFPSPFGALPQPCEYLKHWLPQRYLC